MLDDRIFTSRVPQARIQWTISLGLRRNVTAFFGPGRPLTPARAFTASTVRAVTRATLRGSAHGAALSGPHLLTSGPGLCSIFSRIPDGEMPPGEANSLSPAQHANIAQYVIDQSGLDADALLVSSAADLTSAPADAVEVVEFAEAGASWIWRAVRALSRCDALTTSDP
ncbi:MAG: hypothetical protein CM15mP125_0140 [Gammaproteobacteria bacterium]|nr:MAG: hypothetical protein CM15mP125_0140 [Gammaproteobacteria bacterium]